jgi:hypothetical protein
MYSGVPLLDPREPATTSWLLTSDTTDLSQASSLAARLARADDTRAVDVDHGVLDAHL